MSFGSSAQVRFLNEGGGPQRPVVFWDKQAQEKNKTTKKPKFSYLGRQQKHTVRNTPGEDWEIEDITVQPQPPKRTAAKPKAQAPAHPKTDTGKEKKSASRKEKKPTPDTAGTVVLTQKEFDAILETIGQLAFEADKPIETGTRDYEKIDGSNKENGLEQRPTVVPDKPPESFAGKVQLPIDDRPKHLSEVPAVKSSPQEPVLSSVKRDDDTRKSTLGVPWAHLTKAEKKKIEWGRERVENKKVEEWDPWGRPGAGAPMRDAQGNAVTDRKPQHITSENPPPTTTLHQPPIAAASSPPRAYDFSATAPAVSTHRVSPPPAAIRSSFAIGEEAPNENRFQSAKDRARKEWLAELEIQREEQRRRKDMDKQKKLDPDQKWTAQINPPPSGPATQDQSQETPQYQNTIDNSHQTPQYQNTTHNSHQTPQYQNTPHNNHQTETVATGTFNGSSPPTQQQQQDQTSPSTHIRGQNVLMDSVTQKELEEKRKKHLEHQNYIKQQIEEKERQKRAEKDARMREEQEAEDKIRRERDNLQKQMSQEKDETRRKEEGERLRLHSMKQAMEEAQEIAEREKHDKRMQKLHRAGHDVTQLHANFEAKMTPRGLAYAAPGHMAGNMSVVEPSYIPGLDPTPRVDLDYVPPDNRTLTPTKLRQTPTSNLDSPRREFGIQTAATSLGLGVGEKGISRESTDIEYHPPIQKKKVRVKSAPKDLEESARSNSVPMQTEAQPKKKRNQKINERPQWGYKNPDFKKPVKQSERDPYFEVRLQKKEALKSQRQEALRELAKKHTPAVSQKTTVASRERSRSRERDREPAKEKLLSKTVVEHHEYNQFARTPRRDTHPISSPHPHLHSHSPGSQLRSISPPIPAIKHRIANDNHQTHHGDFSSRSGYSRNKYMDNGPIGSSGQNNDFMPFIRSSNVLDPSHAESPLPLSREPSVMAKARNAYLQEHNPAKFGYQMDNYREESMKANVPAQVPRKISRPDPLLQPEVIKEHPTFRQNEILQHLSDLRKGLMQKQKELESNMPDDQSLGAD